MSIEEERPVAMTAHVSSNVAMGPAVSEPLPAPRHDTLDQGLKLWAKDLLCNHCVTDADSLLNISKSYQEEASIQLIKLQK